MRGRWVCDGYLVCLDLSEDLPGNGARNPSCYLLSMRWFFPWRGKVMHQSSVSISLSFWEPRYQSSRRLLKSPTHLHKQTRTSQPTRKRGCKSLHSNLRKWDLIEIIRWDKYFWYFYYIDWKIKDANKSRWKTYMIKDRPGGHRFQ